MYSAIFEESGPFKPLKILAASLGLESSEFSFSPQNSFDYQD